MSEKMNEILSTEIIVDLVDLNAVVYLTLVLFVFYIGKKVYDLVIPYNLNHELVETDNKAVALSFSGYLIGIGIILWGVLGDSPDKLIASKKDFQFDLLAILMWGFVGIILLQLSRIINNKFVLYQFDNFKELITDRNIGTGAVQCGAFITSALMIRGSLSGEDTGIGMSLALAFLYFIIGQLGLIIYAKAYQLITKYDIHDEIEKDNIAAGVAFGLSMVSVGVLLSGYMHKHDSIIGLGVWFLIGTFLLFIARLLVDKFILPGRLLDDEISKDQNWGAALIEGCCAIVFAYVLNAIF